MDSVVSSNLFTGGEFFLYNVAFASLSSLRTTEAVSSLHDGFPRPGYASGIIMISKLHGGIKD
ncbi:hypothetical protein FQN57_003436 [Myotisia sp. PD_48]|nr:hypothetical protein FQN57_003436 [Myotisia sp. PD_48]